MSISFAIVRKAILPTALAVLACVSVPAAAQSSTAPTQRIDFSSNPFNNLFVGPAFRITGLFQLTEPAHLQYSFATSATGWSFSLSISQLLVAPAPLAAASPAASPVPEQPVAPTKPYELGFNFEYKPAAVSAASTGGIPSMLFASTQPAGVVDMSISTNGQFTDVNVQGRDGSLLADISVQQAAPILPVPEPLEWMIMTSGLLAAAGLAKRRARRAV